ncbi:LUD domain-containing protein [Christiangramia sabulilitoris]|uniref:Lactate utilization protein B/C n=1 Tax=Christiangramia sabulilitoris TaxID=2583991 RepID=A0A550I402_9FLAO|nr:LUD domain-containing protein [Christiangramia sabulilitoris]TRO65558.1 lactate utilization protein B/C [Christiangramia sabulilitoris]
MNLFKRFLNPKSKADQEQEAPEKADRGKYMPEVKLPTDERFMLNFKNNGGKFLYCVDDSEIREAFDNILMENDWYEKQCCCFDEKLISKFKGFNLAFNKSADAEFYLSTCEFLVANDGSILISSNQIKERKLHELPANFIILASTSQLIDTIGEGLRGIKFKNKQQIPSNITTIKNFETQKEGDFMTYGSSTKNLYLLLLEDL